jgi:hypothetical protein
MSGLYAALNHKNLEQIMLNVFLIIAPTGAPAA